jgi:dTDP-4-dehydrorhamnose 3,5-epimerase
VADVIYKCTALYDGADDRGIVWNDPEIGIAWPIDSPIVSEKDSAHPRLSDAGGSLPSI